MRVNIESGLSKKVEHDIRSRLVDVCHFNDGSITDLFTAYDYYLAKFQNSYMVWVYDDKPSHLRAKAYHATLKHFGYERRSPP